MTRIIDLSLPVTTKGELRFMPEIQTFDHKTYADLRKGALGLDQEGDLPEWGFCAIEKVSMTTHVGTHLDAPWHFAPHSKGKPAKTIDQVPLNWCYADGCVLDFHHFDRTRPILVADLKKALAKIEYKLKPKDIVLIRTDASKYYPQKGYENQGAGLTADSTRWLIEQGIKITGIDSWTWDQPFDVMLKRSRPKRFLEAHWVGAELEYCHLESLTNLDAIPRPFGFKVAAFPIKIEGASGGWVRAVAIIEE
jgi:kynurenine formamidase